MAQTMRQAVAIKLSLPYRHPREECLPRALLRFVGPLLDSIGPALDRV